MEHTKITTRFGNIVIIVKGKDLVEVMLILD